MNKRDLSLEIRTVLAGKGASLVGFADLSLVPADARDSMRFAVSIAVALDACIISGIRDGPTQGYYYEYRKANALLSGLGKLSCSIIGDHGYNAVSRKPTHAGIDPKTQSTALPHKTVATRAGLGWIGKCALLVTKEYGCAIRISTVLTDAPLEVSVPVDDSACGDCAFSSSRVPERPRPERTGRWTCTGIRSLTSSPVRELPENVGGPNSTLTTPSVEYASLSVPGPSNT